MPEFHTTPNGTFCIIPADDVQTVVQEIVPLLEDVSDAIYFDGWDGLGASAVLRAIAQHPPPFLQEKFQKIIHIDWSRWKSPRARQREIVDELKLTHVAALFDMQDEEDDFNGIDQGSRTEIKGITTMIARSLSQYRCLVILHNGGDDLVDLTKFGIPELEVYDTKILWTFRGWLRLEEGILRKVDTSHLQVSARATKLNALPLDEQLRQIVLYAHTLGHGVPHEVATAKLNALLALEAREIALCTHKLGYGVTTEIATECCLYLLSMNHRGGGDIIDYNWATHASNYWVCDGIVQGDQDNQAWELAHALQEHLRLEDYSFKTNKVTHCGSKLDISTKHWVSLTNSYFEEIPSGTTSLFFTAPPESGHVSFPSKRFHEADQLRVLKLCRCTFNFSSPPFHCCRSLRFLGLDRCMDEQQLGEEEEKTGARAMETFQRLWVLDVSHTDWELDFPIETNELVSTSIREVHINKGRIWRNKIAWKRLPNLHKLLVVEPTMSWWEEGREDEFKDMVKLELLDLSGNRTIRVLPSLSGAVNLKTLVLDGCVGLEHVGPQGLPPYLESFCFGSGLDEDDENKAKLSRISLAGCARLADFRLHGSLPNLEELDLSHTAVKMLDLKHKVTVQSLQKVFLVGCEQLRSISWPHTKGYPVRLLCIDTRAGGEVTRKASSYDSSMVCQGKGEEDNFHAFVAVTDMRFLQSIYFLGHLWKTPKVKVNLCWSSTIKDDGRSCHKKKMGGQQVPAVLPLPRSLTYQDVNTTHQITTQIDGSTSATAPFQPLDFHMEIGEGVSDVPNTYGSSVMCYVMRKVTSLNVHDSSSITAVTPEYIFASGSNQFGVMSMLKWCRVERCPRLQTVFNTQYEGVNFCELETFWAAHLLMARSIWHNSPRTSAARKALRSFGALRAIHLHFCPRLRYVLEVSWNDELSQLETLHILSCGDLRQVFLVEGIIQKEIAASREESWLEWKPRKGMLQFTKLKDLYLHDLSSLQLICETKIFAPNLETIYIRGCWGLRRLPATDARRRLPVAVDCEKDWWDKLEWDGMEFGHHRSLFKPRHSKYYKKRHLRGTVLR